METAYAQALEKMIENGKKPKEAVRALYENLRRLGRASLFPKIGRAFERIAQRNHARNAIILSVAQAKEERAAQKAARTILSGMDFQDAAVTTHVDESLIGGWRLEGRERLMDNSYKRHLLDIYRTVTSG